MIFLTREVFFFHYLPPCWAPCILHVPLIEGAMGYKHPDRCHNEELDLFFLLLVERSITEAPNLKKSIVQISMFEAFFFCVVVPFKC